ncbi:MAG: ABC transporter substrate-binding protein [Candidimonas sp.]|nr:MAG: ABC transporter substrate-binding protein [Candidimonas sp.]TAM22347.1 MAG: ABC transporter substrate-binding protein [Candidimonas sp.]TAM80457.1 MAG: ABC transporter substrate-binding protein [Candidimonas sp.]
MKRRSLLKMAVIAFPSLMTVARPSHAAVARKKISYAYLLDPAYDAVVWAINNGKVTSDLIDVETKGLAIPQLLQATSSKQHDIIMTAVIGLPAAASRGLELRILNTALQQSKGGLGGGIWVKKDSPLSSPKDLKGKILGSYSLKSTGYTQVRIALQKKYGLNTNLQGGDLKQLQIPASNLPAALSRGSIDAATLIHSQAYKALRSGEYRTIAETARDNIEMFKVRFVSAVNVSYPEKLSADPQAYLEFSRMFDASIKYVLSHKTEVFNSVSQKSGLEPAFFEWWFDNVADVPGDFTKEHAKAINKFYELSEELGIIKKAPPVESFLWDKLNIKA